jgi:hypothetical protein
MAKKVPPPFTATLPDPGGKPQNRVATSPVTFQQAQADTQAFAAWIRADMDYKESLPQAVSDGGRGVSN